MEHGVGDIFFRSENWENCFSCAKGRGSHLNTYTISITLPPLFCKSTPLLFRVVIYPVVVVVVVLMHLLLSFAARGGHVAHFWPMRYKWKSLNKASGKVLFKKATLWPFAFALCPFSHLAWNVDEMLDVQEPSCDHEESFRRAKATD